MSDSFIIRPAESSDSEGIARVHTLSWQRAYRGLLPAAWLDALRWEDRKKRWDAILSTATNTRVYIASNFQNEIVGFASIGPCRDEDLSPQDVFELYAIYVAPDYWRTGIGSALLLESMKQVPSGPAWLSLWVLEENTQGRNFYEGRGFAFDGSTKMANIGGEQLPEVRYRITVESN